MQDALEFSSFKCPPRRRPLGALLPFASWVNCLLDYLDRFNDAALKGMFRVFWDINGAALAEEADARRGRESPEAPPGAE